MSIQNIINLDGRVKRWKEERITWIKLYLIPYVACVFVISYLLIQFLLYLFQEMPGLTLLLNYELINFITRNPYLISVNSAVILSIPFFLKFQPRRPTQNDVDNDYKLKGMLSINVPHDD